MSHFLHLPVLTPSHFSLFTVHCLYTTTICINRPDLSDHSGDILFGCLNHTLKMATQDAGQPQRQVTFEVRQNSRGLSEISVEGRHLSVPELRDLMQEEDNKPHMWKYICKNIPPYPNPVVFEVSKVSHVTDELGIDGIMKSEGFDPPESKFSWWHLKIDREEITSAEKSYVEKNALNNAEEPYQEFLEKFTTSPAFTQESRYGNYRFTFPLTELMEWYKEQKCKGEEPVLRVYKTVLYKQEIVYVVLVHSPEYNQPFKEFPLLNTASEWVKYEEGKITWEAQAICETHWYELISTEVQSLNSHEFYVWDQVSLAFHLPNNTESHKVLTIPRSRLIEALEACELDTIDLSDYTLRIKSKEDRYEEAKTKVGDLKKELEDE